MQFIKDEELKPFAILDDKSVLLFLPGHQEFEHHKVSQQNIGRILGDSGTLCVAFLASVAAIADLMLSRDVFEELVEFAKLTVGQRVHRIDDDRLGPGTTWLSSFLEDRVDDRKEEADRLARTCACCDDKASLFSSEMDRLNLVGS